MSNSPLHPIMAGLFEAFAAPRLPDGLTGESLAAALLAQGFDACTVEPLGPGPLEVDYPAAVAEEGRSHHDVINERELEGGLFRAERETSKAVRAGKLHVCESCDVVIGKGEECLRTIVDRFTTWRHLSCAAKLLNARGELVYDCADLRRYVKGAS